ncbi:hypothetical protein FQN60_008084 [Etheostoma spectabile]|uniref:Uncharacterized protein n=1 Tax=Etheostoma spectabile TaxID=54343 RepID=A0A5J5CTG1_9PERO|nr:hypothetical protein FQN60_008084 [Etheostoma spectabile]
MNPILVAEPLPNFPTVWSGWYLDASESASDRLAGRPQLSVHTMPKRLWRNSMAKVPMKAMKNMTSAHWH